MSESLYLYQFHEFLQPNCDFILKHCGIPETVIEIGVYQGYFTFNMTHLLASKLPNYKHYAIDPFDTSPDLDNDMIAQAYQCFQHNLSVTPYKKNIEFIRKKSWDGLLDLINRGVQADFIYIDGDHTSPTVLQDLILSFNLLKKNGLILCDDSVTWGNDLPIYQTPRMAVDNFVQCFWDKIQIVILPTSYQTAFIKK